MSETRIVDLSYTISSEMLVYPHTERPCFQWLGRVNSEGYNLTRMTMLVHTGTHVDASKHFLDDVPCIDEISLDKFCGSSWLFRCKDPPSSREVTLDEVKSSGLKLGIGDIFVLATGIESFAEREEYNQLYPYPSMELVQWLVAKRIRAYMTDATSVDPVDGEGSPNHHRLLGAGIPIVENLRNLTDLPMDKAFVVFALPIKLGGREGAPCRAIALPGVERLGL